jgi:hypothetical protein
MWGLGKALVVLALAASTAHGQFGIYRDDFGNDAIPHAAHHNYHTGTVPEGGIWTGVANPTNGGGIYGDPPVFVPADFVADGFDFFGNSKAGKLRIEDLNLHPGGVGFDGERNNAPFLYREIPASNNFTATTKIDAQTAGNWSYAPIIARLKGNPPLPLGLGVGDPRDPRESFITAGSFRGNTMNPNTARVLLQNVNGASDLDLISPDVTGLPLWIRMTKLGSQFTSHYSLDGLTYQTGNSFVNANLNQPGETLQVGLSFMMFGGGEGFAEFDFFKIAAITSCEFCDFVWRPLASLGGSGDWNNANNWRSVVGGLPNNVGATAFFGSAITAPSTVLTNSAVTVKSITFVNANKYAIGGSGSINLQSDENASRIDVDHGAHEIEVPVTLGNATTIDAAAGTQLDINNRLDFMATNRTLTVTGAGRVNINNNINLAANGIVNNTGHLGGSGRINGTLNNQAGGTVSPGTSTGVLTVDGSYIQNSAAILDIELGGTSAGTFDKLLVHGVAQLNNGTLNVSLAGGFVPQPGDSFEILRATGNLVNGTRFGNTPGNLLTTLGGSFMVQYDYGGNGGVTLLAILIDGVLGDFNSDGMVDAADYVVWRKNDGTDNRLPNDNALGTPIREAHYELWRSRFGKGAGAGSSIDRSAVPEPSCFLLTSTILLIVLVNGVWRPRQVAST